MRYMMMVMGDAEYEAGTPPSEQLQQAMGEYIAKTAAQGVFVDGAGLLPSRHGFKVRANNGEISFTDGPFTEAREIVGGYAIVEVRSEDEARQICRDFIAVHTENGVPDVSCEIRRIEEEPAAE